MNAKDHYDSHLGHFYSWMIGDLLTKSEEFLSFLKDHHIGAQPGDVAVDLGAGNGIQTIALAKCGFEVVAIDFNEQLLNELRFNTQKYPVSVIADDLRNVGRHARDASLICCCGDTITHLDGESEVVKLVLDIFDSLRPGGKVIFSFRDYSVPLEGIRRFIPVKSDETRILTCVLEYEKGFVTVTDLLQERVGLEWHQQVSSYKKVRLDRVIFIDMLLKAGFKIQSDEVLGRMITVVACKALKS